MVFLNLLSCSDVIRAISEAISIVKMKKHDPFQAHERVKTFYSWEDVTSRTVKVYDAVLKSKQMDLMERIQRYELLLSTFSIFYHYMIF